MAVTRCCSPPPVAAWHLMLPAFLAHPSLLVLLSGYNGALRLPACDVATRGGSCTLVLARKLATPAALQCVPWNQVIWVQTFRGDLGHVLTSSKFTQMEMITALSLQDAESIRLYSACLVQPPFSTGQRPQGSFLRGDLAEGEWWLSMLPPAFEPLRGHFSLLQTWSCPLSPTLSPLASPLTDS